MCEEISILRRWQHVSDRPPLLPPQSSDRALHVKRVLASAFDWNFLVILLYYILVKWVRCHLDLNEVEVIETSNLATVPSRHVSGYMANCWLWLGDSYHHHHHRRRFLQVNTRWKALDEIYKIKCDMQPLYLTPPPNINIFFWRGPLEFFRVTIARNRGGVDRRLYERKAPVFLYF